MNNDPFPFLLLETKRLAKDGVVISLTYHGKHGDSSWNISTPEKEAGALKKLFELFNEWGFYHDLKEPNYTEYDGCEHSCAHHNAVSADALSKGKFRFNVELYQKAKSGDMKSLARLLEDRCWRNYEYERWEVNILSEGE